MVTTLPPAVIDLAARLGARAAAASGSCVTLTQRGRMKRTLGKDAWMAFTARQTIETAACNFAWRARMAPLGLISVCDAIVKGIGGLDVTAAGIIPLVRSPHTPALLRGELMRYLGELPWAPDAILHNPALRWSVDSARDLVVGTGEGDTAVEVTLGLDSDGRIATVFAPDRPRSAVAPILPTPWRGKFSDYRLHSGRWLPFAGEVAWEIAGEDETYWQGTLESWAIRAA